MINVGMTRHLDPMDRIKELSDASVPFSFDVHALFFSDDAVDIEHKMHARLSDHRVNRVNLRREFFYATPAEARDLLKELAGDLLQFDELPEAVEFHQSHTSSEPKTLQARTQQARRRLALRRRVNRHGQSEENRTHTRRNTRLPTPQHRQFVCVCRSGQTGLRGSKDCAAWRYLDGGHAPAVEHQEPITVGGAKHAGVFREGFDESLDDLSLVAVILKRDVELVTAHQANPQLYFCHTHAPCLVAPAQSRGHPPL